MGWRPPLGVRWRFLCACVSQVEISRRVTLEKLPPVLVLHLKRFVYEKTGGCQKLIKNIEYPVDLEISKGNDCKAGASVMTVLEAASQLLDAAAFSVSHQHSEALS